MIKKFCLLFSIICMGFSLKAQDSIAQNIYNSLNSNFFKEQFVGLYVMDLSNRNEILNYNGEKYFTPASNTKIFTLYTSMKLLKDSVQAFRYFEQNGELHIEGTGDPTFLHPDFKSDRVIDFLKKYNGPIVLHWNNFDDDPFAPGWAWEDYETDYEAERSAFPIYGNLAKISKNKSGVLRVTPAILSGSVKSEYSKHHRYYGENKFYLSGGKMVVPFIVTPEIIQDAIKQATGKEVILATSALPKAAKIFYSRPIDEVYKPMMENSDNFLAEQLLLQASGTLTTNLSSKRAINYMLSKNLADLPQKPEWNDGSGLSRYNLFSPKDLCWVLQKLYSEFGQDRLYNIFAVGGKSGTIRGRYVGNPPYIIAKTGTLSNNYCLSGYIITKSGKTFSFSIMHNHFTKNLNSIKVETEKILKMIRDNY